MCCFKSHRSSPFNQLKTIYSRPRGRPTRCPRAILRPSFLASRAAYSLPWGHLAAVVLGLAGGLLAALGHPWLRGRPSRCPQAIKRPSFHGLAGRPTRCPRAILRRPFLASRTAYSLPWGHLAAVVSRPRGRPIRCLGAFARLSFTRDGVFAARAWLRPQRLTGARPAVERQRCAQRPDPTSSGPEEAALPGPTRDGQTSIYTMFARPRATRTASPIGNRRPGTANTKPCPLNLEP
jgi:hypothetical protein